MRRYRRFTGLIIVALLLATTVQGRAIEGRGGIDEDELSLVDRPLLFVSNQGQWPAEVRFQMRGLGATWWFTDQAVWLTITRPDDRQWTTDDGQDHTGHLPSIVRRPWSGVYLRLTFPGLNPNARWRAMNLQPAKVNYLRGQDESGWRLNVPTYGRLRFESLYPGVDLAIDATGWQLVSKDSTPASRSERPDPLDLRVQIEGAQLLRSDEGSQLIAETSLGPFPLPIRVQAILDANTVSLSTFPFSRTLSPQPPTDDPNDLLYSTFLGGSGDDEAYGLALDSQGAAYITGETQSSDFPTTPGVFDLDANGGKDVFVSKLSADGSALEYSTYLGGTGADQGLDITVSPEGSVVVVGNTTSRDFPVSPGAYDRIYSGSDDAFITRLSPAGDRPIYSTYLGGSGQDIGYGLTLGTTGIVHVVGTTDSTNYPTTPNAFQTQYAGGRDAFVAKLTADGSDLLYSTYLGGAAEEQGYDIALDRAGTAYVTGLTVSSAFPVTPGAVDTQLNGMDAFITHLNSEGTALLYSTFLGGGNTEQGFSLTVDGRDAVYVTGQTISNDYPTTPGAYDTSFNSGWDAFISKISADGSQLEYSTYLGGSGDDCEVPGNYRECQIAVDRTGAVYLIGVSRSSNWPTTPGGLDLSANGGRDAVVAQLSPDGGRLLYGAYLGGGQAETCYYCGLAVNTNQEVYFAGMTASPGFPTTPGAFDRVLAGSADGFVSRLNVKAEVLHVANIEPYYIFSSDRYQVGAYITIGNEYDDPVADATVTGRMGLPDGRQFRFQETTDLRGIVRPAVFTTLTGTYTFTVTQVLKSGSIYDPAQNAETSDSIAVP